MLGDPSWRARAQAMDGRLEAEDSVGAAVEVNGLCCSAFNGGVACLNVSAGVAFFASRDHYELISDAGKRTSQPASQAPKTP